MATAAELGTGGVDAAGKPIFVATEHTRYAPSVNRELSDQEQLAWKSFQLWRTSMAIERRDSVYRTITNSDYTNFNITRHMMGTPYPVIDNTPSLLDCLAGIRLYEHGISALVAFAYSNWIYSKPSTRNLKMLGAAKFSISGGTFLMLELCFCYRSMFRLSGFLPNDYECRKFGVMETHERLEHKKEMWERYAAYKKEWCRRFDYHVYGIRPGENFSFFSACWLPAWEPSYGKITDYPLRKNPYFLSSTPLRDSFVESMRTTELPRTDSAPLARARPEVRYVFRGPINAAKSTKPSYSQEEN
ncbi:NADH-ubiquinone oxidoreductase complex I 21 kDa subunit [Lotmaria passim]